MIAKYSLIILGNLGYSAPRSEVSDRRVHA